MNKISREILWHFQCGECQKWWSIGDADPQRSEWFCPWCGKRQQFDMSGNAPEENPHPSPPPHSSPDSDS